MVSLHKGCPLARVSFLPASVGRIVQCGATRLVMADGIVETARFSATIMGFHWALEIGKVVLSSLSHIPYNIASHGLSGGSRSRMILGRGNLQEGYSRLRRVGEVG
jgi:hypothetical protein